MRKECECKYCKGTALYYDKVKRKVIGKNRKKFEVFIERYKCSECGKMFRVYPDYIIPQKQYLKNVIRAAEKGIDISSVIGYEDYPCDKTIERWTFSRKK